MANIIPIHNFSAPELDIYARYNEIQLLNRHEPHKGIFIAESPIVIQRALDASYTPISMLIEEKHLLTEKELLNRCKDIPIYTAEFDVLKNLTGFPLTRGALCAMQRNPLPTVADITKNARRIVLLENVVNPTNVGAIFRSAAALNMDGILLTPACSNPLYRRAIRVSMGTVFQIPWTFMPTPSDSASPTDLTLLRDLGFQSVAMALRPNSLSVNDARLAAADKLVILMGTEGDGLSEETLKNCDYTVCIPMSHGVDSLNVAAASAIAFWELGNHNTKI